MITPDREAELLAIIAAKDAEIKLLRERMDLLVRKVFGSSSEKLDPAQLELLGLPDPGKAPAATGVVVEEPRTEDRSRSCKVRRPRLPEHLPVEEVEIIPLEVQAAPEAFRRIGEEVSEQLDYRPARYLRRRTVRPKYVRVDDKTAAPLIAPLPPLLREKLLATPAMIAHVVVSKYADHLPLYRQADILWRRHQIPLSRQTLNGWVMLAASSLRLIYETIKTTVVDGDYLQVDETPIRYLDPGNGKTKTGYFWTLNRPGHGTVYEWFPSRAADCLDQILPRSYRGVLQCDGYGAYPAFALGRPITLAACWAHARRKFYEAFEHESRVGPLLDLIGQLYAIERQLREVGADPEERACVRHDQARPILGQIHHWLIDHHTRRSFLPQSGAGKAIAYTLKLWPQLQVYVDHGIVELDNNLIENAIRPTAIGKKNWLFIGAEYAGQSSAILFTLMQECRRLGLNPEAYLTLALSRIPTATNHTAHTLTPAALAPLLRLPQSIPTAQAA
jgi:transposase